MHSDERVETRIREIGSRLPKCVYWRISKLATYRYVQTDPCNKPAWTNQLKFYMFRITFNLEIINKYSEGAVTGIIAHEFAHVIDSFPFGLKNRDKEEERVNTLACAWGFSENIKQAREEDRKILS